LRLSKRLSASKYHLGASICPYTGFLRYILKFWSLEERPKFLELEQEASATGSAVVAALARRLLLRQQPMLSPARAT
jgi:hypothetical protein